jgi:transcriptional regulator with XRE-family HTH domain
MSNDTGYGFALARNTRRLRVAARLSLSELARSTGIGKATLSAIENGRGNPTVETLAAIAGALHVPVVDLLETPEPDPVTVVRVGRGAAAGTGLERVGRLARGGEVQRAALEPNTSVVAPPRPDGSRIHLVVTRGTLVAGPDERISELGPGDYASFPADVPHVFRTARRGAEAVLVVETR